MRCPLFLQKPLDTRPYIPVSLFDQKIVALLDSSATSSVLGSKDLEILKQFDVKINRASLKT